MKRWILALAALAVCLPVWAQRGGTTTTQRSYIPECTATTGNCPGDRYICESGGTLYVCDSPSTWSTLDPGSGSFSGLSGGTNSSAAMVIGTGASLAATGSGTITATNSDALDSIDSLSFLRSDAADTATGLLTIQNGLLLAPDTSNVTTVVAYDQDSDGTLEMTDLQAIVTAYGSNLRLVVPPGNWVSPDNSANSFGVLEVTNDNVHIECEPGAILNGPKRYASQQDDGAAGNNAALLTDVNASFPVDGLINYTLVNWTDGSKCTVTDNDATTVTCTLQAGVPASECNAANDPYDCCTGSLAGSGCGTDTDWDDNDYYALYVDELRAVYFSGTQNVSIRGCEVDYGLPDATADATVNLMPFPIQPSMAISCIGCNRFWIQDNYTHDTAHAGIFAAESKNGVVTGNIVERAGRYGTNGASHNALTVQNAIQFYADGTVDGIVENMLVANNLVKNYTASCIKFRKASTSETSRNHNVVGNTCINADVSTDGQTDCVNMISVENAAVSNTVCINAPFHITTSENFLGETNGENSQKNIRYDNFLIDNSTSTLATEDVIIGDFVENVSLEGFTVISQGGDFCLYMDPPFKNTTFKDLRFIDCNSSGGLAAWHITNVSATNHALGGSGSCSNSDCSTGVTEDSAFDLNVDGITFENPGTTVGRFLNDVAWFGATIKNVRITEMDTNVDVFRMIFNVDYPVQNLTFSDWYVEGTTTGNLFDFERTGTLTYDSHRMSNIIANGIGGYLFNYGDDAADITITGSECRGAGCDGVVNFAGTSTSNDTLYALEGTGGKIGAEKLACAILDTPTTSDTDVPLVPMPAAATITAVACHVNGTSATLTFEDNAASPNTIKSSVSCESGATAMTYQTSSLTNTSLVSGEFVQFDVTAASSPSYLAACVKFRID